MVSRSLVLWRLSESFTKLCWAKGLHCALNPFPSISALEALEPDPDILMPTIAAIPLTDLAVAIRHSQNMPGRSGTVCLPRVRAVQDPC
jgi:hypothetical protein